MNLKNGFKNISYSIVAQVVSLLLGILIPRLIIVSYGSEINGLLSTISTIISYLSLLEAGVGAATCQALYRPIVDKSNKRINEILSATHYYYRRTGIAYFLLIVLIAFGYPLLIKSNLSYWFTWLLIVINGLPGVINFFFQRKYITLLESKGCSYVVTNLQTIITVFSSVMKIVLLSANVNIIIVQLIYCFTALVQMIYIRQYIKKKFDWVSVKEKPDYSALKQKNAALIHQICSLITNSTDVIILSVFCDLYVVSIYSIYNMLFGLVYNAMLSINSGVQFILGQAYCKGKEYYIKVIDAYETYYVAVSSALLLVTYVMIIPFLKLYTAGADVSYVNQLFPVLFLAVKLLNALRNAALNTISVSGQFTGTQRQAIIESGINLCISTVSVWKFGMIGVLVGTVVAFAYRCIVGICYANRKILNRGCVHSIKVATTNLTMVILLTFTSRKIDNYVRGYVEWGLVAVIMVVVSLGLFVGVNSFFDFKSFKLVKELAKKYLKK